ncbi:MAG: hypothetical protein Q4F67_06595 [Propionibacteriaceae bacterium]|nr:hypothetical protein [Propionibacteriaceae bacterium]
MLAEPLNVLFVCTANISRSPFAERLARMLLGDAPVAVASAGIPGVPGRAMDPQLVAELVQRGGDGSGHVSRCLDEDLLDWADLVLTFEYAHHLRILDHWPARTDHVFALRQFAQAVSEIDRAPLPAAELVATVREVGGTNSMGWDIDDPYGRGRRAARVAAQQIGAAVETIVTRLTGAAVAEPVPPPEPSWRRWRARRQPRR